MKLKISEKGMSTKEQIKFYIDHNFTPIGIRCHKKSRLEPIF